MTTVLVVNKLQKLEEQRGMQVLKTKELFLILKEIKLCKWEERTGPEKYRNRNMLDCTII